MFSGILVSKDVLLDIKFLRYETPCCYRGLGGMKSAKMFIWKYAKLSLKKNYVKYYLKKQYL